MGAAMTSGCANDTRPHLLSSPPRRGNGFRLFLVLRTITRQILSQVFQRDGERFSLSSGEWAGVRASVNAHPISGERNQPRCRVAS